VHRISLHQMQRVCPTFNVHVSNPLGSFAGRDYEDSLVLLLLDRNIDLTSTVSHGWTYQSLVSDCLNFKLNRVVVPQGGSEQKRSYDLDSKDYFWARNASVPFPQVAEDIDVELNKYKQDAAEITRSTGVSNVNDIAQL
jgi:hypothetical protein